MANNKNFCSAQILPSHQTINPEAVIDIAYLTNKCITKTIQDIEIENVIEIEPFELSFLDFTSCFYYQSSRIFNINIANALFKPLMINNQKFISGDGIKSNFSLYTQCLKAYAKKNGISENCINVKLKIEAANQMCGISSLATNNGSQNALSWDNTLEMLKSTGQIIYTGDNDDEARISTKITYVHYSEVLNTAISIIYTYKIKVPCYKNIYSNIEDYVNVYSKYETNSIEFIKNELKDSLNKGPKISFKKDIIISEDQEDHEEDVSISESTFKTNVILNNLNEPYEREEDESKVAW